MDVNGVAGAGDPPAVEQGYRVDRLLGTGGRARVWLAVRDDGTRFALKIPRTEQAGRGSTFETRRELNILSRFEHENLLQLYTLLDTDQGPGLLMEYAPGRSLSRLAEVRGLLTPGEAVTVLAGIGSALGYLHDQGLTHGDVSPGNILFTAHGKPLLADLGMGRLIGTGGPEVPGTSEFQDPAFGAGAESDVYSLAAVGWFILTGHLPPPAGGRTPLTAQAAGIPAALAAALEAGLQAEPRHRPDAAAFRALVLAGADFEPLDLALPPLAAATEPETRRLRSRQQRSRRGWRECWRVYGLKSGRLPDDLGLDPLTPVRHRWHGSRVGLFAAALLVSATLGLGAVAVAAPDLLSPSPVPGAPDTGAGTDAPGEQEAVGGADGADPTDSADPTDAADSTSRAVPTPGEAVETPAPSQEARATTERPLSGATGQELERLRRSDDPVRAVTALAELRARAFLAGDAAQLETVNVPGSPAMAADRAEMAKLARSGTALAGLAVEVVSAGPAAPADAGAGRVSIPATVSTSAYSERDTRGRTVRTVGALPRQDLVLVLAPGPSGWRIEDILTPP